MMEDEGSGEGAEGPYGPGPVQDPFGHDGRCSAAADSRFSLA